ncbi:MAG: putative F0F1-ATPase subunit Ca2+/Mg2+ transporter [Planctomycetota bacterium]
MGAGMTLAVSVGLFAYGGLWLDERLGTKPWLLLLGVGFGVVGGILHLIRVLAPELWPFGKLDAGSKPTTRATESPQEGPGKQTD